MNTLSKEKCIEQLRRYNRNEIITIDSHTVCDIIYHLSDRASEVGVEPEVMQKKELLDKLNELENASWKTDEKYHSQKRITSEEYYLLMNIVKLTRKYFSA